MDNIQVFLILILIRLIIPTGILITIGEWQRHREANDRLRNEHMKDSILQSSVPLRSTL
jgi:cytochrome oxidase assembly protein ShyY1